MRLAKILVPVDFSGRAAGALHYAKALAAEFQAELTLVHVFELSGLFASGPEITIPPEWYQERLGESRRMLDEIDAGELRNMPVERKLLQGDVARSIVEFAHTAHMDLIVMPTHGYGGFRRFILGSVTAKVLHDADCPVLTGVHIEEMPPLEPILFRDVVCAVDFDAPGRTALRWAADFSARFQSRLTIVHALPQVDSGPTMDVNLPLRFQQAAEERMSEMQKRVGTEADTILQAGAVVDVVRDAAGSRNADLMVIGRHENPGLMGRLREHTYAIIRESPCPVVSV